MGNVAIMGPGGMITCLNDAATERAAAGRTLLATVKQLDQLAASGASALPVVAATVPSVQQGRYEDVLYVAWPASDVAALASAWKALGLYGSFLSPFETALRAGDAMRTYTNRAFATALVRSALTVDLLRSQLRANLRQVGITDVPPDPTKPAGARSKFPWGWVLGTTAFGLGLGFLLYVADRHYEAPPQLQGDPQDDERVRQAKLRLLAHQHPQNLVDGKWTPLRQGETMTTMIIETPVGNWQARVHTDGTWSVRGPDPDNEAHYASGDTSDFESGNDKKILAEAKKRARAEMKRRMRGGAT